MNRLPAVVVLLTLALTCLPAQAQPAAPTNAPLPDRELVIAIREVPPFVMKRKDGSWHGISIALWHRIAERLHVRYRFAEQTTNQEILDGVVKGTFDAGIAAITITAQRERAVDFTLPYYTAGLGVAVSTGEPRWRAIFRTLFSLGFLQAVSILLGLAMCDPSPRMINQVPLDAEFDALAPQRHRRRSHSKQNQLVRQRFPLQDEMDQQGQFKGPGAVFDGFPKSLQKTLVDDEARSVALQRYYSQPTEAQARAFYDEHKNDICPSGRVVSHILVKTEAQAKAILAELKAGKSFADLAKQSIDTQSAKVGGQLGCLTKGTFVPVFENAALRRPRSTRRPIR